MSADDDNGIGERGGRASFAIAACLHALARLVFRRAAPVPVVDWRGTFTEVRGRFFHGLRWGFAICLLVFPLLFCPWPQSRHSLYDELGKGNWIVPCSIAVVTSMGLAFMLTTRAKLKDTLERAPVLRLMEIGGDLEERAKTNFLGILLPMAADAYALYNFTHPRRGDYIFQRPMNSDTVIALGTVGLGIALFLHGIGFVPYRRVPGLRYLLAAVGVALFMYGVFWPPDVR